MFSVAGTWNFVSHISYVAIIMKHYGTMLGKYFFETRSIAVLTLQTLIVLNNSIHLPKQTWLPPFFLLLRIFLRAKFILFCQSYFILNLWSSVWSLTLWLLLCGILLIKERHRLMNRRSTKWSNYSTNGQNQKTH